MAKKIKGVTCIKRKGTTYWYARVDGRRVCCGKGDRGYKVAVAARSKSIAKQYEKREIAAGLKVKKVHFKTVTDLSNWYMQLPSIQKQKGFGRKISACVHLLAYFGKRLVSHVEADDQERYRERRKEQGAAENTIDTEIRLLSAMYNLARKRKKIHAESMPGQFVFAHENNPRRTITDEEFETLIKHADEDFRDVLICGYESAMRSGEIANLRAYQVHLDAVQSEVPMIVVSYIDLGIFDTKTGARRTVPVSPRLKEVLERRLKGLKPEDHVFHDENGPYTIVKIARRMPAVCKKAGIPYGDKLLNEKGERVGVVFHCLRHTRTTKWVEMGFSDEIIRRATGHRTLDAYRNYIKLGPTAVMRLVDQEPDNSGIKRQNQDEVVENNYLKKLTM